MFPTRQNKNPFLVLLVLLLMSSCMSISECLCFSNISRVWLVLNVKRRIWTSYSRCWKRSRSCWKSSANVQELKISGQNRHSWTTFRKQKKREDGNHRIDSVVQLLLCGIDGGSKKRNVFHDSSLVFKHLAGLWTYNYTHTLCVSTAVVNAHENIWRLLPS